MTRNTIPLLLMVPLVGALAACPDGQTTKEGKKPEAQLLGLELRGDVEVEKYDLDGDGQPDVWKHYVFTGGPDVPKEKKPRLLARQDIDLNFDGKVDVKRYFNAQAALVREEMDLDFDERFDAVDYYADGVLYRRDIALNTQGQPSIVKFYNDQTLTRKERDTDGDGSMDVVEYYEGGKLVRIGEDRDGDGKPDVYREVEAGEAAAADGAGE